MSKTHHGAKVYRLDDTALTPYQRVLKSSAIEEVSKAQINSTYAHLNPMRLLKQINDNVERLWQLRDLLSQGDFGNSYFAQYVKRVL